MDHEKQVPVENALGRRKADSDCRLKKKNARVKSTVPRGKCSFSVTTDSIVTQLCIFFGTYYTKASPMFCLSLTWNWAPYIFSC